MKLSGVEVHILDDKEAVAEAAAEVILRSARESIRDRGDFKLVLAGGTTPTAAYRLVAKGDADWAAWHIFHGDERCLTADAPERNSRVAADAWLDYVPIPRTQIHHIAAELGARAAAAAYAPVVADALPFDLVLLGMGEDGHTASLFPGHEIPPNALVMPVYHAPKPPPERVSLTPKALCRSRMLLLLITGAGKREALRRWQLGETLPITAVMRGGHAEALLDREAAA